MRPTDAIWWHRSGSKLAQVMVCYLTAPSHYLNHVGLSLIRYHLRAISEEISEPPFSRISLKMTHLNLNWNLPGTNEWNSSTVEMRYRLNSFGCSCNHCNDVITGTMATEITSLTIVYLTFHSGAGQRKHKISTSLAFVWGIHRWPVNSPHKCPVTRKMFPFDDVVMETLFFSSSHFCIFVMHNISSLSTSGAYSRR